MSAPAGERICPACATAPCHGLENDARYDGQPVISFTAPCAARAGGPKEQRIDEPHTTWICPRCGYGEIDPDRAWIEDRDRNVRGPGDRAEGP